MNTEDKWKADPKRGAEFTAPRHVEVLEQLRHAADVAFLALDEEQEKQIALIKKQIAEKKVKVSREVHQAENLPQMVTIRKYWSKSPEDILMTFVHNLLKD